MCGRKSRRFSRSSVVFCFSLAFLLLSSSISFADHVLTDQQYNKLISNLTELQQITQQQQTVIDRQQKTLDSQQQTISRQQQTISNSQTLLDEQATLLPQVSKSFDQAVQQAKSNGEMWRFVGITALGMVIGYSVNGPSAALIGGAGAAAIGGTLWIFHL